MPEGSGNKHLWHGRRCLLAGVEARGGGQGGAAARICSGKPDTSERQVLLGQACWRWLVYGKQKERVPRQPAAGRPPQLWPSSLSPLQKTPENTECPLLILKRWGKAHIVLKVDNFLIL